MLQKLEISSGRVGLWLLFAFTFILHEQSVICQVFLDNSFMIQIVDNKTYQIYLSAPQETKEILLLKINPG